MALLIGQACSNERGEIVGGRKGDQNQREVRINTFYDGQVWQIIFRCKDRAKAKLIGRYMADACKNDAIGYDTGDTRYSCWVEAMKLHSLSAITTPCNTDCSQLMCICVNLAGIPLSKYLWTAIEDELLMSTGMFDRITDQSMLRGNGLLVGDILWRSGHTAVVVESDEAPSPSEPDKTPKWVGEVYGKATIPVYASATGTAVLPEWGQLSLGNLFDVCDERNNRYFIRIAGQYYGYIEKQYCLWKTPYAFGKVTTALHLRAGAGAGHKSIMIMPQNATVQLCDQKPASDGRPWDYVIYAGQYGFCSDRYIKS